ncbi:MAG: S46 family peptidase [Candidatus Marinimicrobia bacterium]|nr:S46 family peptidase [Candidatus Neomarinimicrobiota bacterium]
MTGRYYERKQRLGCDEPRHGDLIGPAFDGNDEAMTSDWQFQEAIQRTIAVRYPLCAFYYPEVCRCAAYPG